MYDRHERPDLDEPILLCSLDGWIDAGLAGATARDAILEGRETVLVASFDADALLDHRARRPTMHLDDGVNTGLTWPSIELRALVDDAGHDTLLLVGAEPDHQWRAFSSAVTDLALDLGVRMVTGIGAYPAPVPHTRASRVVATAVDQQLAQQVGFVPGRIDVPAGVHASIELQAASVGLPAVGLWAQVPHYVAAMPYPAGAVALIESLTHVTDLRFPLGTLDDDARASRARIDELVSSNPEHETMVRLLEEQDDAEQAERDQGPGLVDGPLPSGDELAAELERYLRDQDD